MRARNRNSDSESASRSCAQTTTLAPSMATKKSTGDGGTIRDYKYTQEISQMVVNARLLIVFKFLGSQSRQMFVFGEVQDPNPDTVNLVEDIVRSQLIELVCIMVSIFSYRYSPGTDRTSTSISHPSRCKISFC
jgi:hypothetical protein